MIGSTAKQLLSELLRRTPSIATVSLTTYVPRPSLAARLAAKDLTEPTRFVREALRHRGYVDPFFEVAPSQLKTVLSDSLAKDHVRGFCSRVKLINGNTAHLPLLDFSCEVSDDNANALVLAMTLMGQKRGALLTSGRSYHYYGYDPLNQSDWHRFMSNSVLLAPLVDVRYVAHCLIEELACLRMDSNSTHPVEPTVIKCLPVVS